ncbi:MAG: helix-turn-helix domain-containing protein [Hymenobacter sp.]|nr:MAG: helix-turn-helix domain-containing protein [Hymenobacter sp.]
MIISNETECRAALDQLDHLIATGFEGIPERERQFDTLAKAIEAYQIRGGYFSIQPKPTTLPAMIELKRQQRQLKQKDLAQLLEVPAGRLSQILSGKRRVTMDLAKKLYERLDISPEFILKTA